METKTASDVKQYDIILFNGEPFGVQAFTYYMGDTRTDYVTFHSSDERIAPFRMNDLVESLIL